MTFLQQIRKDKGYTQQDLCNLSGVSISTIQKLETGVNKIENSNVSIIMAIARALNISVEELIKQSEKLKTDRKSINMNTNWYELIEQNHDSIIEKLEKAYRDALERTDLQFTVTLFDDGTVQTQTETAGSNWSYTAVHDGTAIEIKTYCFQCSSYEDFGYDNEEDYIEDSVSEYDFVNDVDNVIEYLKRRES